LTDAEGGAVTEGAGGVGAELAAARQELGIGLPEVAQQLKFGVRQLEALEADRFDQLPGGTFARGMVRNYARLLKVDPEPLLARLAGRFDAPDSNQLAARFSQPVPFSDGARRSTFVYLGLSAAILVVVAGIAYQWQHERNASRQMALVKPKAEPAVRKPALPPQPVSVAPAPVPEEKKIVEVQKPVPEEKKSIAVQATIAAAPASAGVHRIVMRCDEEAWLEVTDATGRQLVSSLNPAGSERVVQGRGPFTLVIGNASHVRVLHNDREVDLAPHTKVEVARLTLP
jgi:cytoskeleton protein RodZ